MLNSKFSKTFFILLISGHFLIAQKLKGIYIDPGFIYKIFTPGVGSNNPDLNTNYFSLKTRKIVALVNFEPSLNLGFKFNNEDKLQFGFNRDVSAIGFDFNCLAMVSGAKLPTNAPSGLGYAYGSLYNNLSLVYKRKIFKINSKIHKGNFINGFLNLGLFYASRPKYSSFKDEIGSYFTNADSTKISVEAYVSSSGGIGRRVAFQTMLGSELTFGKNNLEWFSLNFGYAFSRNSGYSPITVNVNVNNRTTNENYLYFVTGSSNAFYITLSRRIYPFVTRKTKALLEKEKELKK